jgi:hypothetical protein
MPATFVYAGINVHRSGLFTGVRGKQISGRSVLIQFSSAPETSRSTTSGNPWSPHSKRPCACTNIAMEPSHATRSISISAPADQQLEPLVRVSAFTAILSVEDAITRETMDNAIIDHAAETKTSHPNAG